MVTVMDATGIDAEKDVSKEATCTMRIIDPNEMDIKESDGWRWRSQHIQNQGVETQFLVEFTPTSLTESNLFWLW